MEPMLYTVSEVAKILKCNQNTVHKLRKSGLLPFLKLGLFKCRKEALEEFLRKHEGYDVTDPYNVVPLKVDDEDCASEDMRSANIAEKNGI